VGDTPRPTVEFAKLYVFAEQIMEEVYQCAIMSAMANASSKLSLTAIRIIYAGTTPGSAARRLMADIWAFQLDAISKRITNLDPEIDGEFMRELIEAMVKFRCKPDRKVVRPWATGVEAYLTTSSGDQGGPNGCVSQDEMDINV
jgi:3-polyprenyl-4-hydroxybenzoate decarboxylase